MSSWTSTSPISGSKWDGPTGCPIISPSNWQEQVLDNLTVLANHNHSGSAGEGVGTLSGFAPAVDNDRFSAFFPTACNGWVIENNSGSFSEWVPFYGVVATSTQGAWIGYDVYLRPGASYSVTILGGKEATPGGIITGCIGGSRFNASNNFAFGGNATIVEYTMTIPSAMIANSGEHQLAFAMDTSSTGSYVGRISYIVVRRGS